MQDLLGHYLGWLPGTMLNLLGRCLGWLLDHFFQIAVLILLINIAMVLSDIEKRLRTLRDLDRELGKVNNNLKSLEWEFKAFIIKRE